MTLPLTAITLAAALLAALVPGGPALAQGAHQHGHGAPAATDNAAVRGYRAANDKMHRDMAIAFTGDADRDFVAGMIPHHQGAIDKARVVVQFGKDPEIKKLAEDVIAAQEKEIAAIRAWQQRQPR